MPNPCFKVCYPSRKEAKKAMKHLNRVKNFGLTDAYFCQPCNSFHLTSMPKADSRRLKKRIYRPKK